jgi:hypothetical protein
MTASKICRVLSPSIVMANTHEVIAKPRPHTMSTIEAFFRSRLNNHVATMTHMIVIAAISIASVMVYLFSICN